jgi:5'-deoxynucleotidase YfbR-like HD superfamily hydrolase
MKRIIIPSLEEIEALKIETQGQIEDKLKNTERRGWPWRGITGELSEDVYSHSLDLKIDYLIFAIARGLKVFRGIDSANYHDYPEFWTGDIIPFDKISDFMKNKLEERAMVYIRDRVSNGGYIYDLQSDYRSKNGKVAVHIKQIDKLNPMVRELWLNREGFPINDFKEITREKLEDPGLIKVHNPLLNYKLNGHDPYVVYRSLLAANGDIVSARRFIENFNTEIEPLVDSYLGQEAVSVLYSHRRRSPSSDGRNV